MILPGYIIEKIYVKALEEVFNEKNKKPLGYTRSKFNSAVWASVGDSVGLYDEKYNQTGVNSLLLVRRKTVIVSMRSDRIVKTVNVSEKTVI